MPATESMAEEIARLADLSREGLIDQWVLTYGNPPPKGISRRLLELSAAYALQAKAFGGLKPALRRNLVAALASESKPSKMVSDTTVVKPGTRLVRVWNGRTYHIEVVADGFLWNEKHYRSLTAIAWAITGSRWSGPRFFGL
jgi:Protein of unknown function (DUF2924)